MERYIKIIHLWKTINLSRNLSKGSLKHDFKYFVSCKKLQQPHKTAARRCQELTFCEKLMKITFRSFVHTSSNGNPGYAHVWVPDSVERRFQQLWDQFQYWQHWYSQEKFFFYLLAVSYCGASRCSVIAMNDTETRNIIRLDVPLPVAFFDADSAIIE